LGKEESKSSGLAAHQNQTLLSRLVVRKGKKRVALMKKKSQDPLELQVTKSGGLKEKKQTALFPLIRVIRVFKQYETSQRSMVEITPQLSSNLSSSLGTSAIGEKEKQIRKDERRKDLDVIYNSGLNNPEVSFTDFLSFERSMRLFEGMKI